MVTISRILCAVDFSDFSRDALDHGVVLAKWYTAQLSVLHVYTLPQPVMAGGGVPSNLLTSPPTREEVIEEVRRFCAPSLTAFDQDVEIAVKEGNAAKEIAREAERSTADLLILGTHGRTGFERLFLGSVTEKVLRSTRVPVLTIPPAVRTPGSPLYKTILCALDFSDASLRALEYALSLARQADARLIVLHVIENILGDLSAERLGHLTLSEYRRHLEEDAATQLKAVIPDEARVWSTPVERIEKGRAYAEILRVAAEERVELIVIGVQGRGALNRMLFGSTTQRVIAQAGCPVLTLHSGTVRAQ
jgi:nucleotide-binding universal stress UspA family protein